MWDAAPHRAISSIKAELARRRLLRLRFPPPLEARYEAETQAARCRTIRILVGIALISYIPYPFIDRTVFPDLGRAPFILDFGVMIPACLLAIGMCGSASAWARESFVGVASTFAVMIPSGFMLVSHAPLASHFILSVIVISLFGNIVLRLRYGWAYLANAVTVLAVVLLMTCRPDIPAGIRGMMANATLTCVAFGLVVNNQLERAERRSFLYKLLETVRAEQLSLDKEKLSVLSLVDPLTGLANRRAFDRRLTELLVHYRATGEPFALLMADVDHFKRFNDHYGHPAGDACLARIGAVLKSIGRDQDMVARYGGEEFAILLPDCTAADAMRIGQNVCTAVASAGIPHANRGDGETMVTMSIGSTACDRFGRLATAEIVITAADRNLYAAKRAGRNRIHGDESASF
jgi:diguanylate cyclase (GGDEF)-like protein